MAAGLGGAGRIGKRNQKKMKEMLDKKGVDLV